MPRRAQRSLAAIFVGIAAVCAGLGIWQLNRLKGRRAANAVATARRSLPPVTLGPSIPVVDSSLVQRRVIASGRFDYAREIVIRGQVLEGVPGIHLVTPLVLDSQGTAVLVNRGFVPSPDALTVSSLESSHEAGVVEFEGLALPIESSGRGKPVTHGGRTSWARLDLGAMRDSLPYDLLSVYIRRAAPAKSAASFPRALPFPPLDDGPHLNYALQWFGFMSVALVFAGVVWRKRV